MKICDSAWFKLSPMCLNVKVCRHLKNVLIYHKTRRFVYNKHVKWQLNCFLLEYYRITNQHYKIYCTQSYLHSFRLCSLVSQFTFCVLFLRNLKWFTKSLKWEVKFFWCCAKFEATLIYALCTSLRPHPDIFESVINLVCYSSYSSLLLVLNLPF